MSIVRHPKTRPSVHRASIILTFETIAFTLNLLTYQRAPKESVNSSHVLWFRFMCVRSKSDALVQLELYKYCHVHCNRDDHLKQKVELRVSCALKMSRNRHNSYGIQKFVAEREHVVGRYCDGLLSDVQRENPYESLIVS